MAGAARRGPDRGALMLEVAIRRAVGDFVLDVDLQASSGVTALFGPSGAGKTSVARCVAGLARPDGGRIALDGRVLFGDGVDVPPHRRGIGYVFQEARLFPHLDVRANLLYGAPRGTEPGAVAEMLDIGPLLARRPAGLSGGEAARVAIGRALLRQPKLLILDEPLASLDARRRAAILPYLERLRGQGVPILYISHAIEEVARLATTLVLLRDGQVQAAGPVGEMLADPVLAALLGPGLAGAVLEGRVVGREAEAVRIETAAGPLLVAGQAEMGAELRLRIRASDVTLADREPIGLSEPNVMRGRVEAVTNMPGGAMVRLRVGEAWLLAQVGRAAVAELRLAPGQEIWAVLRVAGAARWASA
ncbi:MAG: molybdenum ABC transporter ATP-binding protein [Pseudomonadota bacterium]